MALARGRVRVAAAAAGVAPLARRRCPSGQVVVCRELTKRYEEVVRGTAAEVAAGSRSRRRARSRSSFGAGGGRPSRRRAAEAAVAELSLRACPAGRRPTSSRGSPAHPGTPSTATL